MFVDDPYASVELAAGLADDSIEALVVSVRERQHSLRSAWQDEGAGTEDMRIALQAYRTWRDRLEEFVHEGEHPMLSGEYPASRTLTPRHSPIA